MNALQRAQIKIRQRSNNKNLLGRLQRSQNSPECSTTGLDDEGSLSSLLFHQRDGETSFKVAGASLTNTIKQGDLNSTYGTN